MGNTNTTSNTNREMKQTDPITQKPFSNPFNDLRGGSPLTVNIVDIESSMVGGASKQYGGYEDSEIPINIFDMTMNGGGCGDSDDGSEFRETVMKGGAETSMDQERFLEIIRNLGGNQYGGGDSDSEESEEKPTMSTTSSFDVRKPEPKRDHMKTHHNKKGHKRHDDDSSSSSSSSDSDSDSDSDTESSSSSSSSDSDSSVNMKKLRSKSLSPTNVYVLTDTPQSLSGGSVTLRSFIKPLKNHKYDKN